MTPIYHITDVQNLDRIIHTNGLWCDAERVRQKFTCVGIAHQDLKRRRARTPVGVASRGTLADYVPFYFTNRSPMLYAIHTGFVEGYDGGQKNIIYLVSSIERVAKGDRPWCFSDGHPVEAMTEFFDEIDELDRVDWAVIRDWSWKDTDDDPDRKRRKQAECLVHKSFPWHWVESIGVLNGAIRKEVARVLAQCQHQPPISIQRKWYYQ
jgi:ssDNA thymidine ADP-ribosyltransferase, DarT